MKRSREAEDEPDSDCAVVGDHDSPEPPANTDELPATKITYLDPSDHSITGEDVIMRCHLPGHKDGMAFRSYDEYQSHYHKAHTNRCLECRKNFPSSHLLSVHIEECHDSFVAVKRERGEHTFSCFVEGCERKCMTHQKRRMHLIDKHMYPKNFFFAVTKAGIDGRSSLLIEEGHHRRRSSVGNPNNAKSLRRRSGQQEPTTSPGEAGQSTAGGAKTTQAKAQPTTGHSERPDTDMEDLAGAMSSLQFIPNAVRFGRGGGKAGFAKK
ncbi:hypothetical protein BN1723_012444 [Verticillium longisporum]|uniref:C2H2-type domain-containing protein n=1 Tax=Verticillium longisporum TaxID=100787 RepID=A0A0G4LI48_VERLO|nr:hypothetical protein BN1723_012444 [Verticillium longisporum]